MNINITFELIVYISYFIITNYHPITIKSLPTPQLPKYIHYALLTPILLLSPLIT